MPVLNLTSGYDSPLSIFKLIVNFPVMPVYSCKYEQFF